MAETMSPPGASEDSGGNGEADAGDLTQQLLLHSDVREGGVAEDACAVGVKGREHRTERTEPRDECMYTKHEREDEREGRAARRVSGASLSRESKEEREERVEREEEAREEELRLPHYSVMDFRGV